MHDILRLKKVRENCSPIGFRTPSGGDPELSTDTHAVFYNTFHHYNGGHWLADPDYRKDAWPLHGLFAIYADENEYDKGKNFYLYRTYLEASEACLEFGHEQPFLGSFILGYPAPGVIASIKGLNLDEVVREYHRLPAFMTDGAWYCRRKQ